MLQVFHLYGSPSNYRNNIYFNIYSLHYLKKVNLNDWGESEEAYACMVFL